MMHKRLIMIAMAVLLTSAAIAANYYMPPVRNNPSDTTIVQTYNNTSGARGMTWLELKKQTSAFAHLSASRRIGSATQIFNLMTSATTNKLVKRADATAGMYTRVMEIKDHLGKIVYFIQRDGQVNFGTPTPLSISSVYPTNGATNISNGVWVDYSSSGGGRIRTNPLVPAVTYNKSTTVSISTQYIQGSSIAPTDGNTVWPFLNFSGAAATTYTMKVVRGSIIQTDGETTSSCGTAMTDVAGICTSTFTMR